MTIGLAAMTPERAFEMYHSNIEDFDQGAPMMMAEEEDGSLTIMQIVGIDVRDALKAMALQGERYKAVLLSNEARMWTYDSDGNSKTEGAVDAAVFTYCDRTGRNWGAIRQFVRFAEGNVRWISDLEEMPPGAVGAVPEGLARLVSADI
jgi:hypothetical protein